jgi:hypothetical protein
MAVSTVSFCLQIYPSLKDIPAISVFVYLYTVQSSRVPLSFTPNSRDLQDITARQREPISLQVAETKEKSGRTGKTLNYQYLAVLVIRDILVRILIQILGSVPLTNRSGCGSGRPKKHTDPTDPDSDADSEHWYIYIFTSFFKDKKS